MILLEKNKKKQVTFEYFLWYQLFYKCMKVYH